MGFVKKTLVPKGQSIAIHIRPHEAWSILPQCEVGDSEVEAHSLIITWWGRQGIGSNCMHAEDLHNSTLDLHTLTLHSSSIQVCNWCRINTFYAYVVCLRYMWLFHVHVGCPAGLPDAFFVPTWQLLSLGREEDNIYDYFSVFARGQMVITSWRKDVLYGSTAPAQG